MSTAVAELGRSLGRNELQERADNGRTTAEMRPGRTFLLLTFFLGKDGAAAPVLFGFRTAVS
jgi:hypothetical protein